MPIDDLIENIDKNIFNVRTRSYEISYNELYDMYLCGELIIVPEYHRLFRWGTGTQSRFIESLLLEIPTPPIYVVETEDRIYRLIDGLQRVSTYLHFRGGILPGNSSGNGQGNPDNHFLRLEGCDIVPDLNGLTFNQLPKSLQIKIKRSFIRIEIVKKDKSDTLKYYMFKRLNTGGALFSAQEIRNCTIRLLGEHGINFIEECSCNADFRKAVSSTDTKWDIGKYDQELVLRFFAFKNDISDCMHSISEFLTSYLEKVTMQPVYFNWYYEKNLFSETFRFISDYLGEDTFLGDHDGSAPGQFILYYYDCISVAVAGQIDRIMECDCKSAVADEIRNLKSRVSLECHLEEQVSSIMAGIDMFRDGIQQILNHNPGIVDIL